MGTLGHNSYGKRDIRLTKVVRNGTRHELFEITASIQIEGDFAAAYCDGDNRACIATDSMKNTVYVLAKEHRFDSIEQFALILARHFLATYPQVSEAAVELTQSSWQRIIVNGESHDHAFTSAGPQLRCAKVLIDRLAQRPTLIGGVRGLLVLKTTASEWRGFVDDRYRTLQDAPDRIMATKVNADWPYNTLDGDFSAFAELIDCAILTTFATRHSLSIQQTLKDMGDAALAACDAIDSISFTLPNLHRIPFNLEPFGLTFENDVFVATDEPYGLINGTITREPKT
ncbi:MAG TPA: urate oxidase [Tepidisphaeraceae bacterium]|nr:urate oxidase [Tepidisphaeraceae bacterium]